MRIFLPKQVVNKLPETHQFNTKDRRVKYKKDVAMLLLWQLQRRLLGKGWKKEYKHIELHSGYLRRIEQAATYYFQLFEQLKIVDIQHTYCKEKKCKGYKLISDINDKIYWYSLDRKPLLNKYNRLLAYSTQQHSPEQLKRLRHLKTFTIDIKATGKWLKTQTNHSQRQKAWFLYNCIKINRKEVYLIKDKYGREHTNYTNIESHIRDNYITIEGTRREGKGQLPYCCRLLELDIPASHPRFLIPWLKDKNIDKDEYKLYINNVVEKDFYKSFADKYNQMYQGKATRSDAKHKTMVILYGKTYTKPNKWTDCYKELYPTIYQAIARHKVGNYKIMAHELQRVEADFIFGFCEKIDVPYFTVHDAVYVDVEHSHYRQMFDKEIHNITNA